MSFSGLLYVLGHFKQKKFFFNFFSPINVVYLWIYYKSKSQSWTGTAVLRLGKRLRLGPLVLTGLTQDRGPDSAFRKGLLMAGTFAESTQSLAFIIDLRGLCESILVMANSESGGKIEPRGRFQVHLLSKRRQSFHIYALLTVCHLCTNHHQLKKLEIKKENVFNRPTEVDPAFVFYK